MSTTAEKVHTLVKFLKEKKDKTATQQEICDLFGFEKKRTIHSYIIPSLRLLGGQVICLKGNVTLVSEPKI